MATQVKVVQQPRGVNARQGGIVLKERLEILPDQPLADFSTPWAQAFATRDLLGVGDGLCTLVVADTLPCREAVLSRLIGARSRGYFDVLDFGSVRWSDGRRRLAIVGEKPDSPALMPDLSATIKAMPLPELIDKVLSPMAEGLANLGQLAITHRGIRPSNIFRRAGAAREYALGDFITGPAGAGQPAVYETIESAMSLPSGRGHGTPANDVFSLGVTLLTLFLGRNPVSHMNEAELMAQRLNTGSFSTLLNVVGTETVTGPFRDLLRGMLQDDPEQRWSIQDVQSWLRERRGRVFVVGKVERALRPISLAGQSFYSCRPLAAQLATKWRAASLVEKKEELVTWLSRSIQDPIYMTAVAKALDWRWAASRRSVPGGMEMGINARLCVALDRKAPLRYKSFAAFPGGVGPALAAALSEPERLRDMSEMLAQQLPEFLIELTVAEDDSEAENMGATFRRSAAALADNRPGQGIERALYELNPHYPCQSPIIAGERVTDIVELLPALERVAANQTQGTPIDRHIAAFVAARFPTMPSDVYTLLASPAGTVSHVLGVIGMIAALQSKLGPRALPKLSRWISPAVKPVIEGFHRRATRERLEAALPTIIETGDLSRMRDFIVGADQRQRDRDEFYAAMREYAQLDAEVRFIESGGASSPQHAREYGHMMGGWIAILLSLAAMTATLLSAF
ncbi:MAG TPA: hypothetical protein VL966_12400 [Alphaproteobacteria bacterium]|nr:hypothetical protein [Alphaproteobacteria bacterium]